MAASSDVMRGALGVSLTAALREKAPDYAYRFRYQSVRADGLGTCGVTPYTATEVNVRIRLRSGARSAFRAQLGSTPPPALCCLQTATSKLPRVGATTEPTSRLCSGSISHASGPMSPFP